MDLPKPPYSKELIATSEIIRKTISPTLAIVNEMNPVSETIRSYMEQNSILNSNYLLDNPFMKVVEERNRALAKMVPSSFLAIQNGLDLPGSNIAKQIAASVPKWDFSGITKSHRLPTMDIPKYDFRIDVLQQDVSKNLSFLLENPSQTIDVEEDDVFTDFDKPSPKSTVYAKDNNQYANDINEIKDLLWQVYKRQEEQMNHSSEKDIQESKQSDDSSESSQFNILAFITGVLTVLSVMTAPKEIYELLIWVDQVISFLLNK
ncbi:hypothetical protein [Enterococcus sp. HMSC072H05]|uniref:hypothetical protein n=1 Tax=Enterococcus sp. HMSC072H05 TaxID=1715012 RepID=UPI0008A2241C|nr:hypothetical protein [Enterococcus sp. HMSC072H05]OFL87285.1 hypothetical protein HMPREF2742_16995 [Enterococcus sp. HMSC072H05]